MMHTGTSLKRLRVIRRASSLVYVAGTGDANFIPPLREIATAFFAMAGMPLTGTAWADGMDQRRDVRQVSGFTHEVQETVRRALEQTGSSEKE
ncbi:hypothetical protein [Methanogenium cariaci]|uniref:hypothetical protein n=1 Tax=Methanogenium cariaci TaxID=2197 RepID=UPI000781C515|nr:hypothetical protein [Methanogenium cariaci]